MLPNNGYFQQGLLLVSRFASGLSEHTHFLSKGYLLQKPLPKKASSEPLLAALGIV